MEMLGLMTNPQSKLTVKGTSAEETIRINVDGASYYHIIRANGDGLYLSADDGATGGSGADIRFAVKNAEKMRINANGSAQLGQTNVRAINGFTSFIDNTEKHLLLLLLVQIMLKTMAITI